jgi:PAS domain S-box-containing protein
MICSSSTIRLLLLEDNPADAELLHEILLDAQWIDWQVQAVSRLRDALTALSQQTFDVVLSDLHLPDARGLETLQKLKAAKDVPIVALTSLDDAELALEAVSLGAQDYLVKGQINYPLLERALRYAIERHQTQCLLRQSEERFRVALHRSPVTVFQQDLDLRYTWIYNPAPEYKSSAEFIGKHDRELYSPTEAAPLTQLKKAVLAQECSQQTEITINIKGTLRCFEMFLEPLYNAQGEIVGLSGAATDISDRKKAELELQQLNEELEARVQKRTQELLNSQEIIRQREGEFRALIENSPDAIGRFDSNGRYLYMNPAITTVTGLAPEVFVGKTLGELGMPENIVRQWEDNLARVFETGIEVAIETEYQTPGQGCRTYQTRLVPEYDNCGQVNTVLAIARDITPLKDTQAELQRTNQLMNAIIAAAPVYIDLLDIEGKVQLWNPAAERIFGWSAAEAKNQIPPMIPPENLSVFFADLKATLAGKPLKEKEQRYQRRDGSWVDISLSTARIFDDCGYAIGAVGIIQDISDRLAAKAQLNQLNQDLEQRVKKRTRQLEKSQAKLEQSNARLQYLLAASPTILYSCDLKPEFTVKFVSENIYEILGYKPEEIIDRHNFWCDRVHPDDLGNTLDSTELFDWGSTTYEYRFRHKNGSYRWIRDDLRLIRDEDDNPIEIVGSFIDISDRIAAQQALQASEERLNLALKVTYDGLWDWNVQTGECYLSPRWLAMLGYEPRELPHAPETWQSLLHPEDRDIALAAVERHLNGETEYYSLEHRLKHKSGAWIWILGRGQVVARTPDGQPLRMVGTNTNIHDRKEAEARLRTSLDDKELLLKEVHHRVKNNLQVISGMFYLQAQYINDPDVLSILTDSQNRIESMALIHEKLYQSKNFAKVDLSTYIEDLSNHLFASYNLNPRHISLRQNVKDANLPLDAAIPCGLLVNELVSNALKHAFPDNRTGEIFIQLLKNDRDELELIVRDNGIGLPQKLNVENNNSLGLRLVRSLARQLKGKLEIYNDEGAVFSLAFPNPKPRRRF